jgi:hypothetical protein
MGVQYLIEFNLLYRRSMATFFEFPALRHPLRLYLLSSCPKIRKLKRGL